ncbi:MAG: aminopeptidase P family protein [Acidobacteria bacterium]|nr:aminopeptidase P family protein [Acidobacteriota bacterium]
MAQIADIQAMLKSLGHEGWLFYDHHGRDPLAYRILGFEPPRTPTRRWFYYIPANAKPRKLVHKIEASMLNALPGERQMYSSWISLRLGLAEMLRGVERVVMQYSPECEIPYVSLVDAGMVDLLRTVGVGVDSSADLVQHFEARWSQEQLETHLEAGRRVDEVRRAAFDKIREALSNGRILDEYEVRQFMREAFAAKGLVTDHGPIVSVNENASSPHYEPTADQHSPILAGDLVLIDLWAKLDRPGAVFYDITWTGYCGASPPSLMRNVFDIVKQARDAGVDLVDRRISSGRSLHGYEVDDEVRGYINSSGYGEYFVHRTGHSIGTEVHGAGANMDNLESHDTRRIIPGTCFSVEPGIYLEKFGIRSEVNVYVGEKDARVTGEVQQELLLL